MTTEQALYSAVNAAWDMYSNNPFPGVIILRPKNIHMQKAVVQHNHRPINSLCGQVFARLTVVEFAHFDSKHEAYWLCQCSCGNERVVRGGHLKRGEAKSCGCLRRDVYFGRAKNPERSGGKSSPELNSFKGAKQRCVDSHCSQYPNYGGRGIEFRFESFDQFLAEVGRKPTSRHSIERKDNNGHYEPGNVQWATPKEQSRNTRLNHLLTVNGETKTVVEWAESTGIAHWLIRSRSKAVWCESCIFRPPSTEWCNHCRPTIGSEILNTIDTLPLSFTSRDIADRFGVAIGTASGALLGLVRRKKLRIVGKKKLKFIEVYLFAQSEADAGKLPSIL